MFSFDRSRIQIHIVLKFVLWIRDVFERIRIRGTVPQSYESGFKFLWFLQVLRIRILFMIWIRQK
jgi:hypothetical protein